MTLPFSNRRPQVSVIVPAFNAEATIGAALSSVFAQTYADFEVIVVDDGSTDGTCAAVAPWRDAVQFVQQENGGPGRARNAGILRARGDLVAFLDADDLWLPQKLALQVEYFDAFPQTGLLHAAAVVSDGSVNLVRPPRTFSLTPPRRLYYEMFQTDVEISTLTVMVPREALYQAGLFDENREMHVEDWDLWLRIAARRPVGFIPCPLAVRRPGGIMSGDAARTFRGQKLVVQKAMPEYRAICAELGIDAESTSRRPLHRLACERAWRHIERGEYGLAREAFSEAVSYAPADLKTRLHHLGSLLPAPLLAGARKLKRLRRSRSAGPLIVPPPAPALSTGCSRSKMFSHDTLYRRSRQRASDLLHDIDETIDRMRPRPRRILFEAASPLSFVVFRPIYRRLRSDPRLQFFFTSTTRSWPAETIFRSVGITERVIPAGRAAWMKFDACINTDFYEMTWVHRRTVRVQLFHGVAGKYGIDAPVHVAPDIALFDRLLFPNRDRLERYVDAGLIDERAALLVGFPKADCLVDGSLDRHAIAKALHLRTEIPTVLYAPTWSPDSSLHLMGEAAIDSLEKAGFNVLVKLHDRSYDLTRRASGGVDWTSRLSVYEGHDRVRVIRDPDAAPYLVVADALVTDHSSIAFEYALLDRPIVVLDAPNLTASARINPEKVRMLRDAAAVVDNAGEVSDAVASGLASPEMRSAARRHLADTMFYRPGTATDRAARAIYDALGIEPPDAASADRTAVAPAPLVPVRKAS